MSEQTTESEQQFTTWDEYDRAAGSIVAEAYGWGRGVDLDDDAGMLAWAREYLPRMLAHNDRGHDLRNPPATTTGSES